LEGIKAKEGTGSMRRSTYKGLGWMWWDAGASPDLWLIPSFWLP